MHSKLFKAETTDLFSNDKFINYNEISNVVVKSTEDGETRFYCRRPDGPTYDKKVELASKPKYQWCSDNYGSKNVEVCQAKVIGIGRLSSAVQGNGHGSYCWADTEVSYDETKDTYTITYIPHPTIIGYVRARRNISGVLCFQFRDFGQPVCSNNNKLKNGRILSRRKRRYGNPNLTYRRQSQGRLYHSNFRFLSEDYYVNRNTLPGVRIDIPDIRYRYEATISGKDMRSIFVNAVQSGRNIGEFNRAQIEKKANTSGQIHTPLIGMLNTYQFDLSQSKYDVRPYNNDINAGFRGNSTRNSVRNNKHCLEVKCRYVLCTYPPDRVQLFMYNVRRCNSQVFTGVVSLDGAGIVQEI